MSRRSSGKVSSHSLMMLGKIANEPAAVDLAEQRRRLAQRHRAGAEGFEHEAVARKLVGARHEPLDVGLVEFDDFRDQQDLPRDAGFVERGLEPLIDDALVRGVLIDDDEPVARLRHDIGLVDLRARGAERMIEKIGGGRLGFGFFARIRRANRRQVRRRRRPPAPLRRSRRRATARKSAVDRWAATSAGSRANPLPLAESRNGRRAARRRRARALAKQRRL